MGIESHIKRGVRKGDKRKINCTYFYPIGMDSSTRGLSSQHRGY